MKFAQSADEIFDVVNDRDEVIGQRTRGEVFLQKRSMKKDTFPGAWDSSASGHLDSGEEYAACALRELREEIGLNVAELPIVLCKIEACAETGQEFVRVYRCEAEGPFELHPEEIETGDWFVPEAVTRWMAERPQDFARALLLIWKMFTAKS